jgi:hypothetical protein
MKKMSRTIDEFQNGLDEDFLKVVTQLQQLFTRVATLFRGRATHTFGTIAQGRARIVVPFGFPQNDFLVPGREYPIVLRHSTPGPEEDDRVLDGAATSIKFLNSADEPAVGFHDILMNTGKVLFVESARAFNSMVHVLPDQTITDPVQRRADYAQRRKKLVTDGIVQDDKLTLGYRTGSFTEFYYHSQVCFEFNEQHYLRYRMIPADRGPERGLFPSSIRSDGKTTDPPWDDDLRSHDFLRRDFETRVRHLGVRYLLQGQLRPIRCELDPWVTRAELQRVEQGLEPTALNPTEYWDDRYYPWVDLAGLELDTILDGDFGSKLWFDANQTHDSIQIPLVTGAMSKNDPRLQADRWASFNHSRPLVYAMARKARAAAPPPQVN